MKKKILPYLLLTPMILIMGVLVFYLVQPPEYGVPSRTDFVWNNHSRGAALSVFEY